MRVAVLGAGIIGITTAYFLKKQGHEVVLVDRRNGPGEECSFSNASQLSYCNAQPWANRGALLKGLKWMGKKDAPLRFRFHADYAMWKWLFQFVMNCSEKKENENTRHILDLCLYSRDVLHNHEQDFNFDFNFQKNGKIFVFESVKSMEDARRQSQLQEIYGAPYQMLSFDELLQYEPNMAHMRDVIVGALRDPIDDTGDAYKFCVGLNEKLVEMGIEAHYNTNITGFRKFGNRIETVVTDTGEINADAFVLCAGAYATPLAKQIGISLPVHPLKGYSITIDIKNPDQAPVTSITYQSERAVFSRIGERMRVSGTAEFAGYNHDITPERIAMLKKLTARVFPRAGDINSATEWACLRPMTPDCRPIIGNSKYDNFVLNTGQGSLGWTMAFASAKMTADIVTGKNPEIDVTPFSLNRF